jgi:hypothetical protein
VSNQKKPDAEKARAPKFLRLSQADVGDLLEDVSEEGEIYVE